MTKGDSGFQYPRKGEMKMKKFIGYVQFYTKGTDKNGLVGTAVWDSDLSNGTFDKEMINNLEKMFKESFQAIYSCVDIDTLEIEFIGKDEYDELSGEPIQNIFWGKSNDHK